MTEAHQVLLRISIRASSLSHTYTFIHAQDTPGKPFVTFTTEAGRVLYIANVPKSMACIVNPGQPTVTFSAPWSPDGTSPPTLQVRACWAGKLTSL